MLMCPAKSHNRTYYDFLAQRYSKIQDRPLVTERRHNKRIVDKRWARHILKGKITAQSAFSFHKILLLCRGASLGFWWSREYGKLNPADTCYTHVKGGNFRGTEDWLPELLNIIRIMRKPLSPEKRKKNIDNEQSYFSFKVNAQETQAHKRRTSKPRAPIKEGVTGPRTKKSFLVWS